MSYELLDTVVFAELEVPVEVKSDKLVEIGGLKVELKRGAKLNLPLRLSHTLMREGIVKLDEGKLYSLNMLNKIRWREERSERLQKLEKDFYLKSRLTLSVLEEKARQGYDSYEPRSSIKQFKITLMDIVKRRVYKIAKIALANPEPSRDLMEIMTREERVLYIKLCDLIKSWQESMKLFIERGEVIER
ncbi:MAG: hypothetical protein DRJ41_02100 [Thermoprotei archaeon]|nr:MAG: hypothetical protein DRJ41_02100 [Thermoprotei archaeon]